LEELASNTLILLAKKWLGLVDDFRTFQLKRPDPEFFEFLAV